MAAQIFRMAVTGTLSGQQVTNVFHYFKADGLPDGTPLDLANAWDSQLAADYLLACPSVYSLATITVRELFTANQAVKPSAGLGGRTGQVTAPQLSPSITWTTLFIGQSHRGRTYLPGVIETDADAGIIGAALFNAMQDFVTEMILPLTSIVTEYTFSVRSNALNETRKVISGRVNTVVRTQRRRTVGVGV